MWNEISSKRAIKIASYGCSWLRMFYALKNDWWFGLYIESCYGVMLESLIYWYFVLQLVLVQRNIVTNTDAVLFPLMQLCCFSVPCFCKYIFGYINIDVTLKNVTEKSVKYYIIYTNKMACVFGVLVGIKGIWLIFFLHSNSSV